MSAPSPGSTRRPGSCSAVLDAAGHSQGREVSWSAPNSPGSGTAMPGTIYKGQGKTLDHTYLYHTHHWRSAASYVALTRQRERAQVFVARETARDAAQLARQMARGEIKAASVAWATREEVAERQMGRELPGRKQEHAGAGATPAPDDSLRAKVRAALQRRERPAENYWRDVAAAAPSPAQNSMTAKVRTAPEMRQRQAEEYWRGIIASASLPARDALTAKVDAASAARQVELPAPEWLIPPHAGRDGRDSLGRGLDPTGIAAAVTADALVQEAKSEPWSHLERAYRNPHAAHARLNELVRAEGWTSAAARIDAEPERLGHLRGYDGIFASPSAQLERVHARITARSLGDSLRRIAEAERLAGHQYRDNVTAQLQRDKAGVPKLSAEAAAVLEAVHAASTERPGESWVIAATRDRPAVARAWEIGQRNPLIAAEIDRFEKAAEQRLGGETGVIAFVRNAADGRLSLPGVGPGQEHALRELARGLAATRQGRSDYQLQRVHDAAEHRQDQRQRQGPSLGR